MREIKFRAWDKFEKQWMDAPIIDGANGKMMAFSPLDGSFVRQFSDAEVDITQYTGLTDKNGVEIYEGDVVQRELSRSYEIKHFGQIIVGEVKYFEGSYWIDFGTDAASLFCEIDQNEIIGNVHENPELLEVEANA